MNQKDINTLKTILDTTKRNYMTINYLKTNYVGNNTEDFLRCLLSTVYGTLLSKYFLCYTVQ